MKSTVYIRRNRALGDVLLAQPLINHFLSSNFRVVFISRHAGIFKPQPNLVLLNHFTYRDKVWFRLKKWILKDKIRWIELDGAYENNPKLSITDSYRKAAQVDGTLEGVNPYTLKMDESIGLPGSPYILFHLQAPSIKLNYRNIHGIDWKSMTESLAKIGFQCIEILESDSEFPPLLPQFLYHDIPQLVYLMQHATAFVGLDSAPFHLAVAFGKPAYVFFGSVNPELRIDFNRFKGIVFQNPCEYSGCYHSVIGTQGTVCKIVGEKGHPPCCTFTSSETIERITGSLMSIEK